MKAELGERQAHIAALEELKERLVRELAEYIDAIVLYGSVARGEATEESDLDLLIIVKAGGSRTVEAILDISYDVDLRYGITTSHLYLSSEQFERLVELGSPLIEDLLTQGVVLYDNGTFKRIHQKVFSISQ